MIEPGKYEEYTPPREWSKRTGIWSASFDASGNPIYKKGENRVTLIGISDPMFKEVPDKVEPGQDLTYNFEVRYFLNGGETKTIKVDGRSESEALQKTLLTLLG